MKKLLSKTFRYFTCYAFIVLAISVPVYYYVVDNVWLTELDEHNEIIADKVEGELNELGLRSEELSSSIFLWNRIQPGTNIKKTNFTTGQRGSAYTIQKRNPHVQNNELKRYRGLKRLIKLNNEFYFLTVETNVEESEETVLVIALVTFLFFMILVIGFLLLNRHLSAVVWRPFRNTLCKLKSFKLNSEKAIEFERSDIVEFEELNNALDKLVEQNIYIYKSQKEFVENASHELQTPLAIIKNKMDLLLQKEAVTERQYHIIEDMNQALSKITRLNKNLLLLSKIENHQFDNTALIDLSNTTRNCIDQQKIYTNEKIVNFKTGIKDNILINGNKMLIEILVNNLLLNAIRYSEQHCDILVSLGKDELKVSNPGAISLDVTTLFRRFSRNSNQVGGAGLGLAIVKEICNLYGWKINYSFNEGFHHFIILFNS